MAFLDDLLTGVSGLTSLGGLVRGLFGGGESRARQERERQLMALERAGLSEYANAGFNDQRTLQSAAGLGADAVRSLTGNLGASLAGGGVYNASSVAGAGAEATRTEAASLAYLANQLAQQRQQNLTSSQRQVAQARLGYANQDQQRAQQERDAGVGGFLSYLGSLSQVNNARTGVTQQQAGVPLMNGTQNKLDYLNNPSHPGPGLRLTPRPLPRKNYTKGLYG